MADSWRLMAVTDGWWLWRSPRFRWEVERHEEPPGEKESAQILSPFPHFFFPRRGTEKRNMHFVFVAGYFYLFSYCWVLFASVKFMFIFFQYHVDFTPCPTKLSFNNIIFQLMLIWIVPCFCQLKKKKMQCRFMLVVLGFWLRELSPQVNFCYFRIPIPWKYFFNLRMCSLNQARCVCAWVRDERIRTKRKAEGGEQRDTWKGWRRERGNQRETDAQRKRNKKSERELKQIIYLSGINREAYTMERIWMTRQLISPNWFWLSLFELPVRRGSVSRQTVISCNLECCLISQTNIKPLSTLD